MVDPVSVARHHTAFWIAISATALLAAIIAASVGPRAWWSIALVTLLVPTLTTIPFGARLELSLGYLPDVVLPLALWVGVPGALVGSSCGWGIRRWRRRRRPSRIG